MKRFSVVALATAFTLALALPALSQATTHAATASATKSHSSHATHSTHKSKKAMHATRLDINSATKEQLMALPGIDDATADKIIAARPFKAKSDLVHKSILTKAQYSKVSAKIIAKKMAESKASESKAPESKTEDKSNTQDQSNQSTPESK
jgi:competence protein ComEA